jgi:hypothetical protein
MGMLAHDLWSRKLQFSVTAISCMQVSFCWIASPLARKFSLAPELAFKLVFLAG